MTVVAKDNMAVVRAIGTPAELWKLAQGGTLPSGRLKTNAHIHLPPNFSAFESVEQAVELAAGQQMSVVGVSNYYDYRVYGDFVARAKDRGIFPLFGIEIIVLVDELIRDGVKANDPGNPGKMYVCGKAISRFEDLTPAAEKILNTIRLDDSKRMGQMVDKLAAVCQQRGFATELTAEDVVNMIVRRHGSDRATVYLQERHIAQAFQEEIFRRVPVAERAAMLEQLFGKTPKDAADHVSVQNEIRSYLMKAGKPAFVEETFIKFDKAIELILELGGIPCYPTLADGASPITNFEGPVETLIANVKARGLHCAEFIPLRNKPEVLVEYVTAMRQAGLVVTAGTEHNTLDLIPFVPACLGDAPVPEPIAEIFWEGACVQAAHQFLVLHGEAGFVDASGKPNASYASDEERIKAFAALGNAVIRKYLGQA